MIQSLGEETKFDPWEIFSTVLDKKEETHGKEQQFLYARERSGRCVIASSRW